MASYFREVTSNSELNRIVEENKRVVIDIGADFCGPCKQLEPKVKALAKDCDNVCFYYLDADKYPSVANRLEVERLPTYVIYYEGRKVKTIHGPDFKELEKTVRRL